MVSAVCFGLFMTFVSICWLNLFAYGCVGVVYGVVLVWYWFGFVLVIGGCGRCGSAGVRLTFGLGCVYSITLNSWFGFGL